MPVLNNDVAGVFNRMADLLEEYKYLNSMKGLFR